MRKYIIFLILLNSCSNKSGLNSQIKGRIGGKVRYGEDIINFDDSNISIMELILSKNFSKLKDLLNENHISVSSKDRAIANAIKESNLLS